MDGILQKLLGDLSPIYSSTVSEEEMLKHFKTVIGSTLGIDAVNIVSMLSSDGATRSAEQNTLHGYVINTGKYYVDNQLSEYSSFPELISYKNQGFASCAVLPINLHGKASLVIELLSKAENKFNDEIISSVALASTAIGIELAYRSEKTKNTRVANYFSGAFDNIPMQLLVVSDNTIIKSNKFAIGEFRLQLPKKVNELLGMDFDALSKLAGRTATVSIQLEGKKRVYYVSTSKISDKLVHVALSNATSIERFSALSDMISNDPLSALIYTDEQFSILEASQSIEKLTGYPTGYVLGKSIEDLVIEGSRSAFKNYASALQSGGISGFTDIATINAMPTHVRFAASSWAGGFMFLIYNANAEKYLSDVKDAFFDFINGTSDMVITVDNFGYITNANMTVESVLGYQRAEMVGKEIKSIYVDPFLLDRDIAYVRNGGKVDNSYVDLVSKSGAKVAATHSIRAFKGVENDSSYIIVVKELETRRRLRDQESMMRDMQNQLKKLRSTSDLKSQFIYNISHELKTPLTNIKGFSKLLYDGEFGAINGEQKEYVSTIIDEANRLMLIIQQVLDAAKLESNKVKLEPKEVDMRDLYENPSIKALQESATGKGLSFSWDVAFDTPKVYADPNRLIQVFVNLIGNAIKFTEKGSITVKIYRKGSKYIQCDVVDTGIGISEEDKHKLFRKFYEAPKRGLVKQDGAGTGLGLSIAKDIVRLHGGKIGFESQLGVGSRFWFTLRVKPKSARQKQASKSATA
ncbi:MAG: ATP-binding protein [Candidatus Micrarchaeia archaeon]